MGTKASISLSMRGTGVLVFSAALAAGVLATHAAAQDRALSWSAGQPSGGWFAQATGIAELVRTKDSRFSIKPAPGAAFDNMTRVQRSETDLAWSLPPVIVAAYNGEEPFKAKQSDIRLVMNGLGFVLTQFCVAADSPARSVGDLFGANLAIKFGAPRPGGSDDWELRKIFAFYKTSRSAIEARGGRIVVGSFADMVGQFRDGKVDAFMLNNAVPASDVEEASLVRRTRILPMDGDLLKYLEGSGLVRAAVSRGSYKDVANNDTDIPTAAMANTIVANARLPADVVHDFTMILLANLDAVRKVHPAFKDFDPRDAIRLANVPLHPGAERAYREAGLLK